jgi:predicted HTH transcriptional regulator
MITKDEIQELLHSTETYRVERTTSTGDMDKFQEAICAFANDNGGNIGGNVVENIAENVVENIVENIVDVPSFVPSYVPSLSQVLSQAL